MGVPNDIDIDKPRYDQNTYIGRAKHFIVTTNPLNLLTTEKKLREAERIVKTYREKRSLPDDISVEDLWKAKHLYDSAFHPDTGEKLPLIGRMSAQAPVNTMMTTAMLVTYQNNMAVIFWQWLNQSFNALVNYSNRSGDAAISTTQLLIAYICATTGALGTALGLKRVLVDSPPLVKRFVPFAAIAAANCVNIPLMRFREIQDGTPLYIGEGGTKVGYSSNAAVRGIAQVIFSRVFMSVPSMGVTPFVIQYLEDKGLIRRFPWLNVASQASLVAVGFVFATPLCCAFFKQTAEIKVKSVEKDLQKELERKHRLSPTDVLVYNKGL